MAKKESDIQIQKEMKVGYVDKTETSRIMVSYIESTIGNYVAVMDEYKKEGEWLTGKGKWIPLEYADEIANLILVAAEEAENA